MYTSTESFTNCKVSLFMGAAFIVLLIWLLSTPATPGARNIAIGITSLYVSAILLLSAFRVVNAYMLVLIFDVATMLLRRWAKPILLTIGIGYLVFGVFSVFQGLNVDAV